MKGGKNTHKKVYKTIVL